VGIAVDTNVLVRYLRWDDEEQVIEAPNAIEAMSSAAQSPSVRLKLSVPPSTSVLRCWRAVATLPTASSGMSPTAQNAIFLSHSTRAWRNSSVPARLRFWDSTRPVTSDPAAGPRPDIRIERSIRRFSGAGYRPPEERGDRLGVIRISGDFWTRV
jgi:hypothetical protein